jgi:hypothetical protein
MEQRQWYSSSRLTRFRFVTCTKPAIAIQLAQNNKVFVGVWLVLSLSFLPCCSSHHHHRRHTVCVIVVVVVGLLVCVCVCVVYSYVASPTCAHNLSIASQMVQDVYLLKERVTNSSGSQHARVCASASSSCLVVVCTTYPLTYLLACL